MISFDEAGLTTSVGSFHNKKIAVLGDLMIDRYYWGAVRRISPEAPVPVVEVENESYRLGGAANVANNIRSLGGEPFLIGLIGNDHPGSILLEIMKEQNLRSDGIITDNARPTTIKTRIIAHDQHVVRVDYESKNDCPDYLEHKLIDAIRNIVHDIDAVILEDYNKGSLTRHVIAEVIDVARTYNKVVTVDPKIKNFLEYKGVTVFKPNLKETGEALGRKLDSDADVTEAGTKLLKALSAQHVLITRGERGMSLMSAGGGVLHLPTVAKHVHDVSGAGDTVVSTLTLALVAGLGIQESVALANCAGGVVVGKVGIVPILPEELVASAIGMEVPHTSTGFR